MEQKIHITVRDGIDPADAVRRVAHVMGGGKISKNRKRAFYCFLTTWKDGIAVAVNLYVKSDCFVVFKNERYN